MACMLDASWLWEDRRSPDVKLILRSSAAPLLSVSGDLTAAAATAVRAPSSLILGHKRRATAQPEQESHPTSGGDPQISLHQIMAEQPLIPLIVVEHLLHSTIVASASEYFKLHLTTDIGKHGNASDITQYELHEDVGADQVDAAGAVLELMYKQKVPAGLDINMLLSMLQISDRWMASGCVNAIHMVLAAVPAASLKYKDAVAIFSASLELRAASGFAPLLKVAGNVLLKVFGDVLMLLLHPDAIQLWLKLPHAALLHLLNRDDLLTDTEDSVLMLVSWWLEGEVGRSCSEGEAEELRSSIRYSCLSTTYLAQVIPQLPRLIPTQQQLLELLEYKTLDNILQLKYFSGKLPDNVIPVSWLRAPRSSAPAASIHAPKTNSVSLVLDVSKEELHKHITDLQTAEQERPVARPAGQSASKLCSGLRVSLCFASYRMERAVSLGFQIHAPLPGQGDKMILRRGTACSYSLSMQGNHTVHTRSDNRPTLICSSTHRGISNFPQRVSRLPGDPLCLEWWAPLLIDGYLRFSAVVTLEK